MYKKQSGAVLMISLVILLGLTLLVLSGSRTVMVQEKMTAAVHDTHISLEIAESGIVDAEAAIEALTSVDNFSSTGSGGLYSKDNGPSDLFSDETWLSAVSTQATNQISGETASFFIEDLGETSFEGTTSNVAMSGYGTTSSEIDTHIFKIVVRSLGRDGNTERIIVSNYAKSF